MNFTQTGIGTLTSSPVGFNAPVSRSMRNTTMFPLSWLAASR